MDTQQHYVTLNGGKRANDLKHTLKIVKQWFQDNQVSVLKCLVQSPGLNSNNNLCDMLHN